jgi:hypothetical protein
MVDVDVCRRDSKTSIKIYQATECDNPERVIFNLHLFINLLQFIVCCCHSTVKNLPVGGILGGVREAVAPIAGNKAAHRPEI